MTENQKSKKYDLEERIRRFAKNVQNFVKKLPKNLANNKDGKQLIPYSGSVEANYIVANKSLNKKDFILRVKISGKEAKESRYC
jgi:four helix bundle protein